MDMSGNKVALTSFPRSGNSLMKKYLEQITGVTTGNERYRDPNLSSHGFMGEGHAANNRVWVSKSHHPIHYYLRKKEPILQTMDVNR